MARSIKPPAALGSSGVDLWRNCLKRDDSLGDSDNPMRRVLMDACVVADNVDALQRVVDAEGAVVTTPFGDKVNPALVESAKQRSLLARLITALRIPDESTGKKPQRRGMRTQAPAKPGGRGATVSSLDRARRASGGA